MLYGLDQAAPAIRRKGRAVLVEGYFDVLMAHQMGYKNVIAPMGTALATIGYGLPEGGIVDTTTETVTTRYTVFRRFTAGHASGYRTLVRGDPATNVLEVDLFLFPGVSGGPTFRPDGRVVGVNRGHRQFGEGASSYGHVIPTQVVRDFLAGVEAETGIVAAEVLGDSLAAGADGAE